MAKDKQVNENPGERRSEQLHQAEHGRAGSESGTQRQDPSHTPDKAEGSEQDVNEALRNSPD